MGKIVNLCILGDSFSGKSSIINTFINSYFDGDELYCPTIENKANKIFVSNKILYNLNIYDTAGLKGLYNLQLISDSVKKCDGFIIVYSLNDRESIDKIDYYTDLIKTYKFKVMPTILVANKMDMVNEICKTESQDLSLYYKMPIIESSSKNLNSIYSVFNLILDEIIKSEKESEKQEQQNRKLLLKRTKTDFSFNTSLKKTKSEFFIKPLTTNTSKTTTSTSTTTTTTTTTTNTTTVPKKKDFFSYFKTTIKDIF